MQGKEIVLLKDLCNNYKEDIVDGPFGANLKREHYQTDGVPVLKIQNIKPFNITLKKMDFVAPEKYEELKRHSYHSGDIIMTKLGDPLGESAIVDGIDNGLIVADLVRIRAQKIDTKYLCYHLNSPVTNSYINAQQKGTTRPRVRISVVRDLPIYAPPIQEQKRIVAILDQAFADIDKARALTEQNLKNARELFESYLQQVFSQRGEGWVESTLGETCQFQGGSQPPKSEFSDKEQPGYIRLIQIRDYKSDNHIVYIPEEKAKRFCSSDDVMIGRYGPPLFQILRGIEGAYNVALMKAIPNEELISKDFLYYFLKKRDILQYIINASNRAAGQIGLNKATIEPYPISYPNLTVQAEIVSMMEVMKQRAASLESIYQNKLQYLDELKTSLLQKAFSGELTKDNQEAA